MTKRVLVAGAGIGGLCSALALAKRGFEVSVYEQSCELSEVGAGLQLSPNAMHVFQALGVADDIKALAFSPHAAVMRHYQSGDSYFSMPLAEVATQKFDADYLHIHRADLHRVLYQACQTLKIPIHLAHCLERYTLDTNWVTAQFDNGKCIQASVLIGADGIKSKVQACMLGERPARFTGQVAWRGVVEASKLPKGLVQPNANLWVGPGKHLVSYYLRGGELVNFVAVEERTDWQQESWHEPGDINQLRQTFKGWHPEVVELLAATTSCFLWALFDRAPLEQWTDDKVALLGDACHPMLPFLAQGAAMAIEDSYALASCLATDSDTQRALLRYQGLRLSRTRDIQLGARQNASLYHMSSAVERAKLSALVSLAKIGLSDKMAARKLAPIYAYNIVEELAQ